jgi:hypothetical protein
MNDNESKEQPQGKDVECLREQTAQQQERPTIQYTELPEPKLHSPLRQEWNTYRREVGRLLADGHEGKFVLIKNTTIEGIFDTWQAAHEEGRKRFLLQPMLVKQLLAREPILRARGYNLPCPSSHSPLPHPD